MPGRSHDSHCEAGLVGRRATVRGLGSARPGCRASSSDASPPLGGLIRGAAACLARGAPQKGELTPHQEVVLRLNHRQMGVGGNGSWGAHTLDAYELFADRDYTYSYRLRPLSTVHREMALSRRPVGE
ncbi:hypothetical protein E0500_039690 [Streptomyces sp. KM273126]|nr:hypothetical protein [Streptomyces sp. KM273126]